MGCVLKRNVCAYGVNVGMCSDVVGNEFGCEMGIMVQCRIVGFRLR